MFIHLSLEGFAATLQKAKRLPDEQLQAMEAQIIAGQEAAEKAQAAARLRENPTNELLLAARAGNLVRVIAAVDGGADVNAASDANGYTPLIWASSRGHTEIVRLLLEAAATVDARANDGQTALMRASDYGYADVATYLVRAGADVNAQSNKGITALRLATLKGQSEIIELLQEAGAKE